MKRRVIILFLCLLLLNTARGQIESPEINPSRLRLVVGTEIAAYSISIAGLYGLWYKDYDQSSFHFFDDQKAWLGMDKAGHFMTSYYLGMLGKEALDWAGVSVNKSVWYGGTLGVMFLTSVEVLDGFSAGWGASSWDLAANLAGSALFIGQELLWKEQRVTAKFSYSPTKYAKYNPELLGETDIQRILKDYNGQTYWLSINIPSFRENCILPPWLSLAVGYGADGMTTALDEKSFRDDGTPIAYFNRYPSFYLSPEIDLFRIHTRSKMLKTIFHVLGFIKFPAPALAYSPENGFKGYWLFF